MTLPRNNNITRTYAVEAGEAGVAGEAGGEKSLSWKGGYKSGFGIKDKTLT
jgi:hypothetical protein